MNFHESTLKWLAFIVLFICKGKQRLKIISWHLLESTGGIVVVSHPSDPRAVGSIWNIYVRLYQYSQTVNEKIKYMGNKKKIDKINIISYHDNIYSF